MYLSLLFKESSEIVTLLLTDVVHVTVFRLDGHCSRKDYWVIGVMAYGRQELMYQNKNVVHYFANCNAYSWTVPI